MGAKWIGAMGHSRIHFAMLLQRIWIAMPIHCQHMHIMLFGQCGQKVFCHPSEAGLAASVATVKDCCHENQEARKILMAEIRLAPLPAVA
jgi:hypothetical protein